VQTNTLAFLMMLALALWVSSASALDRTGAIDAAKRQVKDRCTTEAPCTFDAKAQEGNWHVRVQFPRRNSPRDMASSYPGGHAIFIINQSGKIIGRMEGE
jgi:hypothetical protein